MRVGVKILLGFGAVVGLTVGLGWYCLGEQDEVTATTFEIVDHDFKTVTQLREILRETDRMAVLREAGPAHLAMRRAGLSAEDPVVAVESYRRGKDQALKRLSEVEVSAGEFQKNAAAAERAVEWGRIREATGETHRALEELFAEAEVLFNLMGKGDLKQIVERSPMLNRVRAVFDDRAKALTRLVDQQVEIDQRHMVAITSQSRTSILIALAVAILLGGTAGLAIHRSIVRPLASFVEVVERVGQGDLTQQARATGRDEIGDLARSFNATVAALRDMATQTRQVTENLNAATAEIIASTQQQAAGSGEQAAAVQETTATIAEINQSGLQITERAKQVAAAAESTQTSSASGIQAVEHTGRTMDAIREQAEAVAENAVNLSEKTQAVGEIIASVDDIAEQSHLVALNAAIEAAAAGEHGRSFSVVAAEIKNLADQSKQATVQVRSILSEIQKGINRSVVLTEEAVKRVESGKQQTEVTYRTIRQLIDSVQQSVQAFQQIVAGANQQQIGFDQVAQAVRSISLTSDQAAASTRQLDKAATNLNAMAQQLQSTVGRYRV